MPRGARLVDCVVVWLADQFWLVQVRVFQGERAEVQSFEFPDCVSKAKVGKFPTMLVEGRSKSSWVVSWESTQYSRAFV